MFKPAVKERLASLMSQAGLSSERWPVALGHANPDNLSQKRLLELFDINPEVSLNLLERADGNIFNLSGTGFDELTDIDGVGPATGARLIVLFALIAQYERWQSA